ncbi:MAG: type II toxin-antitoxin system Phd/YefM family antitoxin [Desulfococcaceae bacterium]
MKHAISKSEFKVHVFRYFRDVEETGKEIIITDRGKPVLKLIPYIENTEDILKSLRNSVIKYDNPTDPVGVEDWETLKSIKQQIFDKNRKEILYAPPARTLSF